MASEAASACDARVRPFPLLLAGLALVGLPAPASATVFKLRNERDIAQAAIFRVNGGPQQPTSPYGETADVSLAPGDTVTFTRTYGSCPAPEGDGLAYVVPDPAPPSVTLTLPVTTGPSYRLELNDAERWIVGQINARRASRGLAPVVVSGSLNRAADAVARDSALRAASGGGTYPFPPPHCGAIPIDWGFPTFTFASVDAPGTDARAAFAHWSDGSARETIATLGDWNAVGVGDGDGAFIAYFARCQPSFETRCELTGDTGDPNIVLPASPTPPGGGAPGTATAGTGPGSSPSPGASTRPPAGTTSTSRAASARVTGRYTFPAGVTAACGAPAGCYVAGTAVAAPRRSGRPILARGGFSLANGSSRALSLTVNAAGRRALRHRRRLPVVISVTVKSAGFSAAAATRRLTLRAPRGR